MHQRNVSFLGTILGRPLGQQKLNGESLKKKHKFQRYHVSHLIMIVQFIVWKSCSNCFVLHLKLWRYFKPSQWNIGLVRCYDISIPLGEDGGKPHISRYIYIYMFRHFYIYIYSHLFKAKPKVQHPLWRWQHARLRSGSFGCFGGWPCEWLARTMKTPCFSWQKNTWPLPQRSTKKCGCGIRWIFFVGGVSAWML